jgi:hypothetical protein
MTLTHLVDHHAGVAAFAIGESTAGCTAATDRCKPAENDAARPQPGAMTRSLFFAVAVTAVACSGPRPAVRHFDDDYQAARLEAMRSKVPLAVEVWAPW